MATIRILSRCDGGEHISIEIRSAKFGALRREINWSAVSVPLTPEEIVQLWWLNARMACALDGVVGNFPAMKTAIESRRFKE